MVREIVKEINLCREVAAHIELLKIIIYTTTKNVTVRYIIHFIHTYFVKIFNLENVILNKDNA